MRKWQVKYRLPNTGYFNKIVEAQSQSDAKKLFQADVPSGIVCQISPVR